MRDLVVALLAWIAAELPKEEMCEHALGRSWRAGDDIRALYDADKSTVYLLNEWKSADLRSRGVLLHELMHHVQLFHRLPSSAARRASGRPTS